MASRVSNASSSSSSSTGVYVNPNFVRHRDRFESDRAELEYNVSGSLHQKSYHHQGKQQQQQNKQSKKVLNNERSQRNWSTTVRYNTSDKASTSADPQLSSANIGLVNPNFGHGNVSYTHGNANFSQGNAKFGQGNANYAHENASFSQSKYVHGNANFQYSNNLSKGVRDSQRKVSHGVRGESILGQARVGIVNQGESGSNITSVMSQGESGARGQFRLNSTRVVNRGESRSSNDYVVNCSESGSSNTCVVNREESGSHRESQSNNTSVMIRGEPQSNNTRGESGANKPYVLNRSRERSSESYSLPRTSHSDESNNEFPPLPSMKGGSTSEDPWASTLSHEPRIRNAWGSLGAPIKSWYDECENATDMSPPHTRITGDFTAKNIEELHKEEYVSSNTFLKGGTKGNDGDIYKNAQSRNDAPRRDTWRQNSQQTSSMTSWRQNTSQQSLIITSIETSAKSSSKDSWKQEYGMRKHDVNSTMEQHGVFEHIGSMESGPEERQVQHSRKRIEEMQNRRLAVGAEGTIAARGSFGETTVKSLSKNSWREERDMRKHGVNRTMQQHSVFERIGSMKSGQEERQVQHSWKRVEEMQNNGLPVDAEESTAVQASSGEASARSWSKDNWRQKEHGTRQKDVNRTMENNGLPVDAEEFTAVQASSGEVSTKSWSKDNWRQKEHGTRQKDVNRTMEQHGVFRRSGSMKSSQQERQILHNRKMKEDMQNHGLSTDAEEYTAIQDPLTQVDPFAERGYDDGMLPFIVGTCEDMCPVREREQRERLRDLSVFERANGNPNKTSRDLAVKKFCRTFSSVNFQPSDVRPLPTLKRTLQYLLHLLDDSEFSFDIVYDFLFDRTRAIRQELDMQRIANSQAINMYEQIVRFHILSEYELHQRRSVGHVSDSHLNLQQLSKSLLGLFNLYSANSHEKHTNEAEFRAYYVLLNLGSNNRYQADSLSLWFRECATVLMNTKELKFARAVLRCYLVGNFWKFFQLANKATFLQSCLMEVHFNEVRLKSLEAMNHGGYKLHPIPLADICKGLLIKEGDLEELCKLCGLMTGMDASRVRCLFVKQSQFSVPTELPSYRCPCIHNKQPPSYYEAVIA